MEPTVIQIVMLLLLLSVCDCQRQVLYIRPSDSSHCPQEVNASQCYDLSTLVSEGQLSTAPNISLLFLPGEYFLEQDLDIMNIEEFQMSPSYTYVGEDNHSLGGVTLTCNNSRSHHSVIIQNVSVVKIDAISFQSCGDDVASSGSLRLRSVDNSEITDCKWYESRNSAIFMEDSNSVISDCLFTSGSCSACSGGGIHAISSNVTFTGNSVVANNSVLLGDGGGLSFSISNVVVDGNLTVTSNSANNFGGGIHCDKSSVFTVTDISFLLFEYNEAYYVGGGLSITTSQSVFNGYVGFFGNTALFAGGMYMMDSHSTFNRHVEISGNSATRTGGGMLVNYRSQCTFNGHVEVTGNSALRSGGIEVYDSCCVFNEQVELYGNSAFSTIGGGMAVTFHSNCTFNGKVVFSINNASQSGGGMAISNSQCIFNERAEFYSNDAYNGGGIAIYSNSYCIFKEKVDFSGNSADFWGGGACIDTNSDCVFNDNVDFVGNSAAYGGGMLVHLSQCVFKGHVQVSDNTVGSDGGGMYVFHDSQCTFNGCVEFSSNSAARWAGGIEIFENSNITFNEYVKFYGNTAVDDGGGMAVRENSNCIFNNHTMFSHNSAAYGGGITLWEKSQCTFKNRAQFFANNATEGGGIYLYFEAQCTFSGQTEFAGNKAAYDGGSFLAQRKSNITFFSLVNISTSTAGWEGGAIFVRDDSLLKMSGTTKLYNNHAFVYGGAISLESSELRMDGVSLTADNSAQYGGAINAITSKLYFSGTHHFMRNSAQFGGGVALSGGSLMYFPDIYVSFITIGFSSKLNMQFISNHAEEYGGAIWIESTTYYSCTSDERDPSCFFRSAVFYASAAVVEPSSISAINNTALSGSSVYGGNIDTCYKRLLHDLRFSQINLDEQFFLLTELMPILSELHLISSDPKQVCLCRQNEPDCSIVDHTIEVFSGQQFALTLVGVGEGNGTVPSVILSQSDTPGSINNGSKTQSATGSCSDFFFTVTSDISSVILFLYPESVCPANTLQVTIVSINIKTCPPGFMLDSETKICICNSIMKKLDSNVQCDIDSQLFSHQHGIWIGYDKLNTANKTVLYHPHCPFDYCKQEQSSFTLNSTDDQCRYDRSGFLCGACSESYSLTLGGSNCKVCSNWYLMLLFPLALAGVVLVLFLLIFRLTVSMGTINGLIFFANVIGTNSSIFLPPETTIVLRVFIAWLNLDLGITTCLFDGLDMYIKVWLQFVFPFYVFMLIAIIIFISQRSTFVTTLLGKNPVAVLATLILLAYTKLFSTVLTVLSFTYIRGFDGSSIAVWLYDGNVKYMNGKHIALVLFALLIMLLLIIPYTVILLFAPYLQRVSNIKVLFWINDNRLKYFLDAYYNPLKDKYRSWVGFLLVLRLCLLIVTISNSLGNPSINLFAIAASVFFILCCRAIFGGIYTNWCIDALELFFIMMLGLISLATLYILNTSGNQRALTDTIIGITFIAFVAITVCHGWKQLTDSRWWRVTLKPKWQKYYNHKRSSKSQEDSDHDHEERKDPQTPSKVMTTFVELREPVLDF